LPDELNEGVAAALTLASGMSGRRLAGRARQPEARADPDRRLEPVAAAARAGAVDVRRRRDHATTPTTFVAVALPARLLRNRRSVQ
jgi:hypothetical protein